MYLEYALFILGFVALVKGADFLIKGSVAIARRFNVSDLVIGLTIVSFGTSLPELIVSLIASVDGSTDLLIGNILGSNISNILLIMGIAAIISKISLPHATTWKEIPFSLLAALVIAVLANDILLDGDSISEITRGDGFILLCFFLLFLYYVYGMTRNDQNERKKNKKAGAPPEYSLPTSAMYLFIGLLGLYLGGRWVVEGAIFMAGQLGISESIIGLSIVAIGTSLPELITSILAALRKNVDLAIGNVVGSNIFNLFFVLGLASLLNPIPFAFDRNIDLLMVIFSSVLLFIMAVFYKPPLFISKYQGAALLAIYGIYLWFLLVSAGI
ncbi:MAG: calcium/sodium antiporter [Candidatus Micrarchaeota archaeon]